MIIKLANYQYGYHIVSLAKDKLTQKELLSKGLNTFYIKNNIGYFLPDGLSILLTNENLDKLNICYNYDVFEIDENGNAYQYYNNDSLDNAIIVTSKCNSNCLMCPAAESIRKNGIKMRINDLLEISKYIPDNAVHLTITGGEPFLLEKDIFTLLSFLKNKFIHTEFLLLTNGRAFSIKNYSELLAQTIPIKTIVAIPLHGYDAITHDYVTQTPGSFYQTFIGLKNIISMGINVELRIVVSKLNANYLNKIADLIISEFPDVLCVKFIGLEMLGNAAKNNDIVWITYNDAFEKSRMAIEKLINNGIDVGIYNFPLCAVDKEFWSICEKSITDYKIRFANECDICSVKDACGGIFAGSIRLAKESVKPIR